MNLDTLSKQLRDCKYPEQIEHIDRGILGAGFYPGAQGFSTEQSPHGGILLLGRDFGTKQYYARLCGTPARDETAISWRHTRDIYLPCFAGLPVWCSNYLIGVRKNGSAKGNVKKQLSPTEWRDFETYCWGFLQSQVLLQRPRLVIVLGGDNRVDLTSRDRIGRTPGSRVRYMFGTNGETHGALVTFADHPHSLIPKPRQEAARQLAIHLRTVFEQECEAP